MLTSAATEKQIAHWKNIYKEKRALLSPNRISGTELDAYFRQKYEYKPLKFDKFTEAVIANIVENGFYEDDVNPQVVTYIVDNNVYIGIDLNSGFFQVESEDTGKMAAIYDDLFVTRGLSENDLDNFFLTAQYIELSDL